MRHVCAFLADKARDEDRDKARDEDRDKARDEDRDEDGDEDGGATQMAVPYFLAPCEEDQPNVMSNLRTVS